MTTSPPTDYAARHAALKDWALAPYGKPKACWTITRHDAADLFEWVASLEAELAEARKERDNLKRRVERQRIELASANDRNRRGNEFARREAEERAERAEAALRDVKLWFDTRPWEGTPDGSSHGGGTRGYSDNERKLGYGTYRDPRHLPAALAVSSASEAETDGGRIAAATADRGSAAAYPPSVSASEPDGETACPACGDSYSQPHWCPVTAIAENPCARCGREIGTDKVRLCRECAEVIAEPDGETS